MSDPWSKETGDKMEQRLSIQQVCDKYNALYADNEMLRDELEQQYARVEKLEAALRIVPGFVTNRARADFVKDTLAATERGDSDG